jgi:hypothetical protein
VARVPEYEATQVEQRALPGARQSSIASPSLFGAAADQRMEVGKGLLNAGTGIANAAAVIQERENADMIFRAETALKDDYLKYEQSVRERRGQNAWGVTRETEDWFGEQAKRHSETLENDKQRYLFGQSLTKLRQSAMGSMASYESSERKRSIEESANASIVGSINMAAAGAAEWYLRPPGQMTSAEPPRAVTTIGPDGTPVSTASTVEVTATRDPMVGLKSDIVKRVQVLANLNGWSPERKDFEEAKHLTNLHKQVLQVLADKDPAVAREYFDANKAEINGSEYDTINKVLKIGETRGTAQAWVDRLDPAQDEGLALQAARIEFADKPELRDAVIAETKNRFHERRQLREAGQRDAADQAWKIYQQTRSMKAIPSSLVAAMDGKTVLAMQDYANNKTAGVGIKTDPTTYYDLRRLSVDDPNTFRSLDLKQYINVLSPSDFQAFVKLQTADESERLDAVTQQQQFTQVHNQMRWGSSDKAKKGAFDKAASDAIYAEQVRRGKKLNQDERQAVIDKMLIQGEVGNTGVFENNDMRYFEATPEQRKTFAPEISKDERKAIIDRIKALKGYTPSEEEITDIYKKWKGF